MTTRPSRVLAIAALALGSIAALALLLPVLGMVLLGLVTLLLPLAVVIVPVLGMTLWWLAVAPGTAVRAPAGPSRRRGPQVEDVATAATSL